MAASIEHPNVIPIYEAGQEQEVLFIAMRYVDGTDLRSLLRSEGALETSLVVPIVAQVAAALDAAHARGLVHRDVKPANVLIATSSSGANEHVYLSDFGLTRRASSDSGIIGTGQFVGTLDYAAPEQFEGADGDRVWVIDRAAGTLTRVDASGVGSPVRVGEDPTDAVSAFGAIWITDGGGELWRVDPLTNETTTIDVGAPLASVAVDRGADTLWVLVSPH